MNHVMTDYNISNTIDRIMPKGSYSNATDSNAIATKVNEDIQFLMDRIERIKKLQTPNSSVLKTYQSMLDSRQAVLQWLKENDEGTDDSGISQAG